MMIINSTTTNFGFFIRRSRFVFANQKNFVIVFTHFFLIKKITCDFAFLYKNKQIWTIIIITQLRVLYTRREKRLTGVIVHKNTAFYIQSRIVCVVLRTFHVHNFFSELVWQLVVCIIMYIYLYPLAMGQWFIEKYKKKHRLSLAQTKKDFWLYI